MTPNGVETVITTAGHIALGHRGSAPWSTRARTGISKPWQHLDRRTQEDYGGSITWLISPAPQVAGS